MSKDIGDILKEVDKSNKELHKVDNKLSKEINSLAKDIDSMQKEIKIISSKVSLILELLNNLTIFIEENGEELEDDLEDYESNEGWLPEVDNWENSDSDDVEDL